MQRGSGSSPPLALTPPAQLPPSAANCTSAECTPAAAEARSIDGTRNVGHNASRSSDGIQLPEGAAHTSDSGGQHDKAEAEGIAQQADGIQIEDEAGAGTQQGRTALGSRSAHSAMPDSSQTPSLPPAVTEAAAASSSSWGPAAAHQPSLFPFSSAALAASAVTAAAAASSVTAAAAASSVTLAQAPVARTNSRLWREGDENFLIANVNLSSWDDLARQLPGGARNADSCRQHWTRMVNEGKVVRLGAAAAAGAESGAAAEGTWQRSAKPSKVSATKPTGRANGHRSKRKRGGVDEGVAASSKKRAVGPPQLFNSQHVSALAAVANSSASSSTATPDKLPPLHWRVQYNHFPGFTVHTHAASVTEVCQQFNARVKLERRDPKEEISPVPVTRAWLLMSKGRWVAASNLSLAGLFADPAFCAARESAATAAGHTGMWMTMRFSNSRAEPDDDGTDQEKQDDREFAYVSQLSKQPRETRKQAAASSAAAASMSSSTSDSPPEMQSSVVLCRKCQQPARSTPAADLCGACDWQRAYERLQTSSSQPALEGACERCNDMDVLVAAATLAMAPNSDRPREKPEFIDRNTGLTMEPGCSLICIHLSAATGDGTERSPESPVPSDLETWEYETIGGTTIETCSACLIEVVAFAFGME